MSDAENPNRILNFRPLFFAAVGFISGVALFESISRSGPSESAKLILFCVSLVSFCGLCVSFSVTRRYVGAVLFGAALLGFARMALASPDIISKGDYDLTGTVYSVSATDESVVTIGDASLNDSKLKYRVKLTVSDGPMPRVGDRIEAKVSAQNPTRRFGTYDERLNLLSNGVSVTAKGSGVKIISSHGLPAREFFLSLKAFLHERIDACFGDSAPIVAGFLLGDKTGIDEADTESFRSTGTVHLLTLSGFHVALLCSLIFFLLPKRYPLLRLVIISAFLVVYCCVTAFSPSLVRASVMCFIMLLADALEERRDSLSALSLSALIILLASPYKLWSVGFRLSFAATFGIIVTSNSIRIGTNSRFTARLLRSLIATLGATAATMLIIAQYFGYFAVYNMLANIAAVPIFSAAIALSFTILVISIPIPAIGAALGFIPDKIISFGMLVLKGISSLPYAEIEVPAPSGSSVVLMLLLLFSVSSFVLRPPKKRLLIGGAVFLLFTASLLSVIIKL